MNILVFTLLNKENNEVSAAFYSDFCGLNESSELWIGCESNKYVVIHPSTYYDDSLRTRRNKLKMVSPWEPKERLSLIAQVWGGEPHLQNQVVVIGQSNIEAVEYGT